MTEDVFGHLSQLSADNDRLSQLSVDSDDDDGRLTHVSSQSRARSVYPLVDLELEGELEGVLAVNEPTEMSHAESLGRFAKMSKAKFAQNLDMLSEEALLPILRRSCGKRSPLALSSSSCSGSQCSDSPIGVSKPAAA